MKTKTFTFFNSFRFPGFVLGCLLMLGNSFAAYSGVSAAILANPGFEDGLNGWGSWGGTQSINTTNVHSGTNSMEFTGEGGFAQTLTTGFVPGATYIVSAYCVIPNGATANAYIGLQSVDGADNKVTVVSPTITNTGSFEKYEVEFTVPIGAVTLAIFVYQEGGTTTIISDDFDLVMVPNNILTNPGFEDGLTGWGSWGGTQSINTTNVHSGINSMEFTGEGGFAQTLTTGLVPGAVYMLKVWCVIPNGATANAYIGLQSVDAVDVKKTVVSSAITNTGSFEEYKVEYTLPEGVKTLAAFVYQEGGTTTILSDDFVLTMISDVALNKLDKDSKNIKLYPNPLTGKSLNIRGVTGGELFSIFDMTGRLVFSQKLQNADNQKINLNDQVSKGTYVIKIAGRKGVDSQLLLVK